MGGCGNGDFCPNHDITNGQSAVFLVRAFDIPFLAPQRELGFDHGLGSPRPFFAGQRT